MFKNKLFIDFSATQEFCECDYYFKSTIRQAVAATLEYEDFPNNAEVSITFCDNKYIRKLNKEYRNKDKATDVLSFPLYDFNEEDDDVFEMEDSVALGDIVISLERAKEQAEEIGNSFMKEVAFLTIHSMLHLLGYDHERSKEDDEAQCIAQRDIIEMLEF